MDRSTQIFKGEPPWGKITAAEIMTKIMLEERPDRPEGTEALGLTTELWDCLTNCLHQKAEDRITISEVLVFLNSMWVPPLVQDQTFGAYSH